MSVVFRSLVLSLLLFAIVGQAQAVSLPGLLGGSSTAQPQASEPLGKSLDEVITTLENDQQRTRLLDDLKKLRDSTRQAQPEPEQGVLGLIGSTIGELEKQFSGDASPFKRWADEMELAGIELAALKVPVQQWPGPVSYTHLRAHET